MEAANLERKLQQQSSNNGKVTVQKAPRVGKGDNLSVESETSRAMLTGLVNVWWMTKVFTDVDFNLKGDNNSITVYGAPGGGSKAALRQLRWISSQWWGPIPSTLVLTDIEDEILRDATKKAEKLAKLAERHEVKVGIPKTAHKGETLKIRGTFDGIFRCANEICKLLGVNADRNKWFLIKAVNNIPDDDVDAVVLQDNFNVAVSSAPNTCVFLAGTVKDVQEGENHIRSRGPKTHVSLEAWSLELEAKEQRLREWEERLTVLAAELEKKEQSELLHNLTKLKLASDVDEEKKVAEQQQQQQLQLQQQQQQQQQHQQQQQQSVPESKPAMNSSNVTFSATKQSREPPPKCDWKSYPDPKTKRTFFFNSVTKVSTWNKPTELQAYEDWEEKQKTKQQQPQEDDDEITVVKQATPTKQCDPSILQFLEGAGLKQHQHLFWFVFIFLHI